MSVVVVDEVEIIDFCDEYASEFERINRQWIEKLFKMEKADIETLEHPEIIIENGGYITFAKLNNKIVGTGALINLGDGVYEIAKMGVDENCRGYGVGDKIMKQLINHAKQSIHPIIHTLKIETSSTLKNAIHLYKKNGFIDDINIKSSEHGYDRADVFLILKLQ